MGCSWFVDVILKFNFSFVLFWFGDEWPNTDRKGRRGMYCVKYPCWSHHLTLFQNLSEACKFCVYYEIHLAAILHDIFFISQNLMLLWQPYFDRHAFPRKFFSNLVMWSKIAQTTSQPKCAIAESWELSPFYPKFDIYGTQIALQLISVSSQSIVDIRQCELNP